MRPQLVRVVGYALLGLAAAAVTFGVGKLIGMAITG